MRRQHRRAPPRCSASTRRVLIGSSPTGCRGPASLRERGMRSTAGTVLGIVATVVLGLAVACGHSSGAGGTCPCTIGSPGSSVTVPCGGAACSTLNGVTTGYRCESDGPHEDPTICTGDGGTGDGGNDAPSNLDAPYEATLLPDGAAPTGGVVAGDAGTYYRRTTASARAAPARSPAAPERERRRDDARLRAGSFVRRHLRDRLRDRLRRTAGSRPARSRRSTACRRWAARGPSARAARSTARERSRVSSRAWGTAR